MLFGISASFELVGNIYVLHLGGEQERFNATIRLSPERSRQLLEMDEAKRNLILEEIGDCCTLVLIVHDTTLMVCETFGRAAFDFSREHRMATNAVRRSFKRMLSIMLGEDSEEQRLRRLLDDSDQSNE